VNAPELGRGLLLDVGRGDDGRGLLLGGGGLGLLLGGGDGLLLGGGDGLLRGGGDGLLLGGGGGLLLGGLDDRAGEHLGGARRGDAVLEADDRRDVVGVEHEDRRRQVGEVQREDAGLRLDVDRALVLAAQDEGAGDLVVLQHLVEQRLLLVGGRLGPEHVALAGLDLTGERDAQQVVALGRRLGGERVALEQDGHLLRAEAHQEGVQDLGRGLVVEAAATGQGERHGKRGVGLHRDFSIFSLPRYTVDLRGGPLWPCRCETRSLLFSSSSSSDLNLALPY